MGGLNVVVFVLDGCCSRNIMEAEAPNISSMAANGAVVSKCTTVYPSLRNPSHASLLTGCYPEKTGIINHLYYDVTEDRMVDISNREHCQADTSIDLLGSRGLNGLSIGGYIDESFSKRVSQGVAGPFPFFNSVFKFLSRNKSMYMFLRKFMVTSYKEFRRNFETGGYNFYFVTFTETDEAGHRYGPGSTKHLEAIKRVDAEIGEALSLASELERETVFIVTSSHGQSVVKEKVNLDFFDFQEIGYSLEETKDYRGAKIIWFKGGKERKAVAVAVSRHVQMWLNDKRDAAKFSKLIKSRKEVDKVFLKEEAENLHFKHWRLGDISFSLSKGYGFNFLPTCEKGEHGGLNSEDMEVPLIFWWKGICKRVIDKAETVDIVPTILGFYGFEERKTQGKNLFST